MFLVCLFSVLFAELESSILLAISSSLELEPSILLAICSILELEPSILHEICNMLERMLRVFATF